MGRAAHKEGAGRREHCAPHPPPAQDGGMPTCGKGAPHLSSRDPPECNTLTPGAHRGAGINQGRTCGTDLKGIQVTVGSRGGAQVNAPKEQAIAPRHECHGVSRPLSRLSIPNGLQPRPLNRGLIHLGQANGGRLDKGPLNGSQGLQGEDA